MNETQICPVCTGSGIVDEGFYRRTSPTWTGCGGVEMCRSCGGKGYIVVPGEYDYDSHTIHAFDKILEIEKRLNKLEKPGKKGEKK